jgi:hypothetical protein
MPVLKDKAGEGSLNVAGWALSFRWVDFRECAMEIGYERD